VPDDIEATGVPLGGASPIDAARFRQVLGHFGTGVAVVAAVQRGRPLGFTAQSLTAVSLDPPLLSVCPSRASTTWPKIDSVGAFCVNVLASEQEAVARTFATRVTDRFAGVDWTPSPTTGSPILAGTVAWVDCRVEAIHEAGDHLIVVARVVDLDVGGEGGCAPLLFYRGGYGRFAP